MNDEPLELVHGSGNIDGEFGVPDAAVRQTKAVLAARILTALDERGWSTRDAERATGVAQSEFSRLRRGRLERFTLDRLIGILGKVDAELEVTITVQRRGAVEARAAG